MIIERSAPLFNTKGYAGTSMSDILEATGLTKGGFYGNFKSKDEVALEAFDYSLNRMKESLGFKLKMQASASGKLFAMLDFYHNYSIKPVVAGGCPILNTAIDSDDTMPALKEKAALAMREVLNTFRVLILKGMRDGEFRKDLDASQEAELFFAIIEGGVMMSKLNNSPSVLNRLLENIRHQIKTRIIQT